MEEIRSFSLKAKLIKHQGKTLEQLNELDENDKKEIIKKEILKSRSSVLRQITFPYEEHNDLLDYAIECDGQTAHVGPGNKGVYAYGMVKTLLDLGCRISETTVNPHKILQYAIEKDNASLIKRIYKCGYKNEYFPKFGTHPVYQAYINGRYNVLDVLPKYYANDLSFLADITSHWHFSSTYFEKIIKHSNCLNRKLPHLRLYNRETKDRCYPIQYVYAIEGQHWHQQKCYDGTVIMLKYGADIDVLGNKQEFFKVMKSLVKDLIWQVCMGLASLDLSLLEWIEILDNCDDRIWVLPYHYKWNVTLLVKRALSKDN